MTKLISLAALNLVVLTCQSADWPSFLGPNSNGTSTETNLLSGWEAKGPPQLWDRATGTGYTAPAVAAGKLFLFHRVGDREVLECLDPRTGKQFWQQGYPTSFQDPYGYNNGPRSSPVVHEDVVYTFGAEGKLTARKTSDGTQLWQRDTSRDYQVPEAFFGVGSSPLVYSNSLIVMVGGQPNAGVVAVELNTGKLLWENVGEKEWSGKPKVGWPGEPPVRWSREEKQASYASPVLATIHGKEHLFCFMRQGLVSLNPANGSVNFSFWFRARVDESVNAINPVVVGDEVLISAAYYRVGSVLLKIGPEPSKVQELWRSTSMEAHWGTPVHVGGYLYGFSGRNEPDARFRCVEWKTGKVAWERDEGFRKTSETPTVFGRGSLIYADGKLIALGEGGLLGLFKPDPARVNELARWQVPQLKYPCWAAPVLANSLLYLRSENHLVCLDFGRK